MYQNIITSFRGQLYTKVVQKTLLKILCTQSGKKISKKRIAFRCGRQFLS